jgi:hypothetical protein
MYIFKDRAGKARIPRTLYELMVAEERAIRRNQTPIDVDGIDGIDDFDFYHEMSDLHYEMVSDRIEEMYLDEAA